MASPPARAQQFLYRHLSVGAWAGSGISPVNWIVVTLITLNLLLQIVETEPLLVQHCGGWLEWFDQVFLILFSIEYVLRVWVAGCNPLYQGLGGRIRYMLTWPALVDLIAIVPGFVTAGDRQTSGLRALRLLRVLRFARFGAFSVALRTIIEIVRSRIYELGVSLLVAVVVLLAASTLMYWVEADANPEAFGSIPRALWWSVVTMTTVGYGDATPVTAVGKVLAGLIAMLSIAIVAIPTGILAASFSDVMQKRRGARR